jgi:hypothetical protein
MNIRKESLGKIVYDRQKAEKGIFCYFSTPKYCLTMEELLDHAVTNHEAVKANKARARTAGQFRSSVQKHASDLRIHSLAILRRAGELPCHDYALFKKVKAQADRTYKLKT